MDKPRYYCTRGFLNGSDGKKSVCNAGDPSSIPGLGRYPGERNGNSHQCSCQESFMDREPGGLQSMGSQTDTTERPLTFSLSSEESKRKRNIIL